jgi:hypothetical protein
MPDPFVAPDLPLYIGSRGEQFNRMASAEADGVFLGGLPDSLTERVVSWAHSVRRIRVASYAAAIFGADALEAHRPNVVLPLADSPPYTRAALGVSDADVEHAVAALLAGDAAAARALVTDRILHDLVIGGTADHVGRELARRVRRYAPDSAGLTFDTPDPEAAVEATAAAFGAFDKELA